MVTMTAEGWKTLEEARTSEVPLQHVARSTQSATISSIQDALASQSYDESLCDDFDTQADAFFKKRGKKR